VSYQEFIKQKMDYGIDSGFEPLFMPEFLFDFQAYLVDWAIRKGRDAIFADCGMGKTPMQLVWGQNVVQRTNKPVLILTPLAVSSQTLDEAAKFDIEAYRAIPGEKPTAIRVTNYERLHHFDAGDYGGVVCDESSILKNFRGTRRRQITEFMRTIPYRLLCTATAAPNDWVELGTSSEALGYLGHMDMVTKFFSRRQSYRERGQREKFYLKGHAAKGPFWRWVSSWARAARKPSDLGFDDADFILPPLIEENTLVRASKPTPGMLFDMPAVNFHEEREAVRRTIVERCEAVAEKIGTNGNISMIWCHLNDEGDMLESLIPGSVQVAGSDSEEKKEEAACWFVHGSDEKRVLISKPTIFGFGLNFQHCHHMTYFPTHSYEQYYQATRRLWRFGQENRVKVDRIYTDGGQRMLANLQRKSDQADAMFDDLVRFMGQELHLESTYERKEIEVPQWMQ
jgi:hypothetical protein